MILSISAVLLLGLAVLVLCRYAGLRGWHAVLGVLVGFYLAASPLAPTISAFAETATRLLTGRRLLSPERRRLPMSRNEHTSASHPQPHLPPPPVVRVDLDAITTRYRAILDMTTTAEMRAALIASVTDIPPLVSEVDRLGLVVVRTRLRHANLTAATLAAARDGEAEPLAYLLASVAVRTLLVERSRRSVRRSNGSTL